MKKSLWTGLLSLAVAGAMALPVMAQGGGGGRGAGGGGRGGRGAGGAGGAGGAAGGGRQGGRGNFDPATFLQTRIDNMKATLAPTASDAEWKILSDKLLKVLQVQQQIQASRIGGGGGRGRGGPGGGGAPAPTADAANPASVAAVDLNTAIQNTAATEGDFKTKTAALRAARTKLQGDLTKAQDDLKTILSVRQEAVLVTQGIVE